MQCAPVDRRSLYEVYSRVQKIHENGILCKNNKPAYLYVGPRRAGQFIFQPTYPPLGDAENLNIPLPYFYVFF